MTGRELIDALAASGTGPPKLAKARALLAERPKAAAADVVNALRASGAGGGTIRKCEALLGVSLPEADGGVVPVFPVRAPLGGATVGGTQFMPGEIVPAELVAAATPDEVRALCKETTALGAQPVEPTGKKK